MTIESNWLQLKFAIPIKPLAPRVQQLNIWKQMLLSLKCDCSSEALPQIGQQGRTSEKVSEEPKPCFSVSNNEDGWTRHLSAED